MPVQFWIGPAGSGKTHACLEELRQQEARGGRAFLLVPEQFTYSADRLLLAGDLAGARNVRVLSFRRLLFLIESLEAAPPPSLERGGREMLLRWVLRSLPDRDLGPFARLKGRDGLVRELSRTFRDLFVHTPEPHRLVSRLTEIGSEESGSVPQPLRAKSAALARILRSYEEILERTGMRDPEERLSRAAAHILENPDFARGLRVFVDGFMSFTVPEIGVLTAFARTARDLVVTLCIGPRHAEIYREAAAEARAMGIPCPEHGFPRTVYRRLDRPVFSPTMRTLLLLEQSLAARDVPFTTRELSHRPRFRQTPLLESVEARAIGSGGDETETAGRGEVEILAAVHPEQEVLAWARTIDRWIRLGGLPDGADYRDAALLLRDPKSYAGLISEIFPRYDIPYFLDLPTDLTYHPLPATLLSVLDVIERKWSRPAVLSLLRSPLLGLDPLDVDLVENVSLEYGIEFGRWHASPWKAYIQPPRRRPARIADPELTEEERESMEEEAAEDHPRSERTLEIQRAQIELGNRVRSSILMRVRRFEEDWSEAPPPFRRAAGRLLRLADDLGLASRLDAWAGTNEQRAVARQVMNSVSSFLENGIHLMGDVPVTPSLFADLLRSGLSALRLSRTPHSLNAVLVGDFQRSRINEARAVIVGGLSAETVPHAVTDRSLMTDQEEARLAESGVSLGPSSQSRQDEEAYLTYIALTRARERLLLTYPASTTTGDSLHVSPYLEQLARRVGIDLPAPGPDAGRRGLQTTEEIAAFLGTSLSARVSGEEAGESAPAAEHRPEPAADHLYDAVRALHRPSFRVVRNALMHRRPWRLDADALAVLYPDGDLVTSPSSLEAFCKCPYQAFGKRVLRLEPRPEAVVQPRDTGTALHAALEELLGGADLPPPDAVGARLNEIFRDLRQNQEFLAFDLDAPSRYQWESGRRGLTHYAAAEARRLARALYKPGRVELDFGFTDERPFLVVPAGDGRVLIRGRMDRVDIPKTAQWDDIEPGVTPAVVVDYKRRFPRQTVRTDIERGERLQNGIYMLALRDIFGLRPAGGFYVGILPYPVPPERRGPPDNPLNFELRGVILRDEVEAYDPARSHIAALGPRGKTEVDPDDMKRLLGLTKAYVANYGRRILGGEIRAVPLQHGGSGLPRVCEYCDYRDLCRFDPMRDPVLKSQPAPDRVSDTTPEEPSP